MEPIMIALVSTIIISLASILSILSILLYNYSKNVENARTEKEKMKRNDKEYVVVATRFYEDGDNITHYHGYNSDKWVFTYEEAVAKKEVLDSKFGEVRILEYKTWMVKTNPRIRKTITSVHKAS